GQVRARSAVLAGPAVAREHPGPGDLGPVGVARGPHTADQPDHDRWRDGGALRVQLPAPSLQQLGLVLQQQHHRPTHRADVDRLISRVQDEHPATVRPAPPVLWWRHGPQYYRWNGAIHL